MLLKLSLSNIMLLISIIKKAIDTSNYLYLKILFFIKINNYQFIIKIINN